MWVGKAQEYVPKYASGFWKRIRILHMTAVLFGNRTFANAKFN